ncbi:MAG: tRNA (N6-isopentenyl adenosine(37)-C2)-methylthiotransferase MiaB [Flavobacteriales bacterium]|nr:tRNA (N6-isopentenyl adenosine(37)-C2)-methylthiotransferase MiaB [Flavobacteriales bacterium]
MEREEVSQEIDESKQGEVLELPTLQDKPTATKKLYLESYGCQMNFADSEIVASILADSGYETTKNIDDSDVVLLNTCAIRDNAEQKIRNRLKDFQKIKKRNPGMIVGMLGCMAERLKHKVLEEEKSVDLVVGPDAYRDLPNLIQEVEGGQKSVNVLLSREETYADVSPVRLNSNGVSAFVSIMRGCDNMCSFCVVPFTRGRERSRDPHSIVRECEELHDKGYKEVTLLGQNVDSYKWSEKDSEEKVNFAELLKRVAAVDTSLRVRFSTSHPKDMTDDVLIAMAETYNICNYIHLPVQSGNSRVLDLMNRGYTREWYEERINSIREIIPGCGISTDIITGFCTETDEDHKETLEVMKFSKYDFAYMFKYSERPNTFAAKKLTDDVPEDIKQKRLEEIIQMQHDLSHESNLKDIGKTFEVLIEGVSKRSKEQLYGRSSESKVIVFPKENFKKGDYVNVIVTSCTSGTLIGEVTN